MPFGLRNAGPTFQRHVDRAIQDCQATFAWVDDIVICSRNHEEHVIHVREVLQALQDNGLVIHAEKCVWGIQELKYLGHKISAAGVLPLPSHVAAIQEFPRPSIIKELQAFLGMVNFYRRFLPSIVRTLRPLTDALRGGRKGGDRLEWSAAMDAAFAAAKQSLLTATHLAHPTVGPELSVGCGRLGDACRGVPAAAATWQEGVAASGLLLKEAGGDPAEIFNLRQGVICLFCRDPPLQVHAGRQAVRHLHGPQAAHLCPG
jgi:hypothetical protein